MNSSAGHIVFENRQDAGRQLAEKLAEYQSQAVVVLAIPNGGVPVALEVAGALKAAEDPNERIRDTGKVHDLKRPRVQKEIDHGRAEPLSRWVDYDHQTIAIRTSFLQVFDD